MIVASLGSCRETPAEMPLDGTDAAAGGEFAEITLSLPSLATRTSAGSDDGAMLTPEWAVGDKFGLLIRNADGTPVQYLADVDRLGIYEPFAFAYVDNDGHDLHREIFTGLVPLMPSGTDYNYYAVYPAPQPEAVDGDNVSCEIPTVQTGVYDGGLDLMWAKCEGHEVLDQNLYNKLDFRFKHLTHALKITVPAGRNNFGEAAIERIAIEFPQPVAGGVTLDIASGELNTESLSSNVIEVHFDDAHPFVEDEPFWVYTAPVEIEGPVRFTAYNDSGSWMSTFVETDRLTGLAASRITPVTLGVTEGFQVTWFDYVIDWTQLGETGYSMTLKLPEGYRFADGNNERTAYEINGRYSFPFRTAYLTSQHADGLADKQIVATYESEHAIVTENIVLDGEYNLNHRNDMTAKAPYLFFEDFSKLNRSDDNDGSRSNNNGGNKTAVEFLDGWSGARIKFYRNTYLRIACYRWHASFFYGSGETAARVDSAPMSNLKENAGAVAISLTFNYGTNQDGSLGSSAITQTCSIGRLDNPDKQSSESTEGTFLYNMNEGLQLPNMGTSENSVLTATEENVLLEGFTNNSRISWRTMPVGGDNNTNNAAYFYIDNVRVSIAPQE